MPNESPHVIEAEQATFAEAIIEKSHQVPVLVDFWADWCGPCQMQLPILLKLAEEYQGKFILAKLDTERERELAKAFQIRSIPTMKLFKNGEIVEDILGAQTETALREILARHIPRQTDSARTAAHEAYQQGDPQKALQLLRELVQEDPENHEAWLDLARISLEQGQLDECEAAIGTLPREAKEGLDGGAVCARLEFARLVKDAADLESLQRAVDKDHNDLEAKYLLSARLVIAGNYEAAFEKLLEIMTADRGFGDDGARKSLLSLFKVVGDQHEMTSRYRKKMFNLLH